MAVTAWTSKQVADLLQRYLAKRLTGYRARAEAIAKGAGIVIGTLTVLSNAPRLGVDVVTIDRYRWRNPYTLKDAWTPAWHELAAAGLAARVGGGWHISQRGGTVVERLTRDLRAYLESRPIPTRELRGATKTLVELAAAIPPDSERARAARRGLVLGDEVRSDIVRLDVAIGQLGPRRDDCHIGAWQNAAYAGPALDVLSQVWEGRTTLDDVAKALAAKQERADVERSILALASRGDLARDGDALALTAQGKKQRDEIERETDRRYFAGWPVGEALARLGHDLAAVTSALP